MSMPVQQQILGFQVAVYDVFRMQVFQRQRGFGSIEFGDWVGESLQLILLVVSPKECIAIKERGIESRGLVNICGEMDMMMGQDCHTPDFLSSENSSPPSTKSMTM